MFIRYLDQQGAEGFGLIVEISADHLAITVRRFMSWLQLSQHVGQDIITNMTFWPIDLRSHPAFLCDTDLTVVIQVAAIRGLAFVFYADDPVLPSVQGMRDMYQVTSHFSSSEMVIAHRQSFFRSHPCTIIRVYQRASLRLC